MLRDSFSLDLNMDYQAGAWERRKQRKDKLYKSDFDLLIEQVNSTKK